MAKNNFDVRVKITGRVNTEVRAENLEEAQRRNEDAVKNVYIGQLKDVKWEEREKPQQLSNNNFRFYMKATGCLDIMVGGFDYDEAEREVDYMMEEIQIGHNSQVGRLRAISWEIDQWLGRH